MYTVDPAFLGAYSALIGQIYSYSLQLCIWQTLLSKATQIAFHGTHLKSYQFLL